VIRTQPDRLSIEETTPVTEAIENLVDEAASGIEQTGIHLQRAISIATTGGTFENYVAEAAQLGISVVTGVMSTWSTVVSSLGLLAADDVRQWKTSVLHPKKGDDDLVRKKRTAVIARANVRTVPDPREIGAQWVRVLGTNLDGTVHYIDRRPDSLLSWDGSCFVAVRQHGTFLPGAIEITITLLDPAGDHVVTSDPLKSVLSLP